MLLLTIPALALLLSLYTQIRYLRDMHRMRDEQFTALVNVALKDAIGVVERNMLADYTNSVLSGKVDSITNKNTPQTSADTLYESRIKQLIGWNNLLLSSSFAGSSSKPAPELIKIPETKLSPSEDYSKLVNAYFYYSTALRDIILNSILSLNNDLRPLKERISLPDVDVALHRSLENVGINEPYSFSIYDEREQLLGAVRKKEGEAYKTPRNTVKHFLFSNIILRKRYTGYIELTFYERQKYIDKRDYLFPTIATCLILLILDIIGVIFVIKQYLFERSRKQFVDNLTHELKTPLTSIMIATEMITSDEGQYNDGFREKMFAALKSETKRLQYLVEKVLQFTLVDDGHSALHMINVNAHKVIDDAYTVMNVKCTQLDGGIEVNLQAKHSTILVDEMHFQNVIYNILDNAIKYRKPNEPPRISITTYNPSETEITIAIADNGIGIAKRDRDRVFKRYVRIQQGDIHNVKGFGLGLSYVKSVIEQMGGKIRISGKKGVGTTMSITLPTTNGNVQ